MGEVVAVETVGDGAGEALETVNEIVECIITVRACISIRVEVVLLITVQTVSQVRTIKTSHQTATLTKEVIVDEIVLSIVTEGTLVSIQVVVAGFIAIETHSQVMTI